MRTVHFNPGAGTHIRTACVKAVRLAKKQRVKARFSFNGVILEATPKTSPYTLLWVFDSVLGYQHAAWEQSRAYREQKEANAREIKEAQEIVDATLRNLRAHLDEVNMDETIECLVVLSNAGDRIGVNFDAKAVSELLWSAGYARSEYIGMPADWFNTKDRMGRYLIGQAMDFLASGLAPHPVIRRFAEQYKALP